MGRDCRAASMSKKAKGRSLGRVPIVGSASHNLPWYAAIGGLVVNWANNESVFIAMLQTLIAGGPHSAAIVWHSLRTTRARLELVDRLCREQVKDEALLKDIQKAISQFVGFSKMRHFYCHALYQYDSELRLAVATGATTPQDGDPIVFDRRQLDPAAMNGIKDTIIKLVEFNRALWELVVRLQTALGVQRVNLPQLPPLQTANQDDPTHPETDGKRGGKP